MRDTGVIDSLGDDFVSPFYSNGSPRSIAIGPRPAIWELLIDPSPPATAGWIRGQHLAETGQSEFLTQKSGVRAKRFHSWLKWNFSFGKNQVSRETGMKSLGEEERVSPGSSRTYYFLISAPSLGSAALALRFCETCMHAFKLA